MSERLQHYHPEEDGGEIIEISSSLREPGTARVTVTDDATFNSELDVLNELKHTEERQQTTEDQDKVDPFTLEGLDKVKGSINGWLREVNEYRMTVEDAGGDTREVEQFYQGIRRHYTFVNELIRELRDLTESEDDDLVEAKAEDFSKNLSLLREMTNVFLSGDTDTEEQVFDKKTGWWDKNQQSEQGIVSGAAGELKQVWGKNDGPIGFEPPEVEIDNEKVRTGWFDAGFKEEQGFSAVDTDGAFTQRGDVSLQPDSKRTTTPLPLKVTAYPLPGGKHRVMMSHQNPEELFPAAEKTTLTPERIEDYRAWVEPTEETADNDAGDPTSLATPLRQGEVYPDEIVSLDDDPMYEKTRQSWLEAKELHETKHNEYHDAAKAYYASLAEQGFFNRNLTRLKASFGFKPELPPEIVVMREEMFMATANYSDCGRSVLLFRNEVLKRNRHDVSDKILDRYNRLLARTLVLNTFNAQRELQTQAAEDLNFKSNKFTEFFKKNKNAKHYARAAGAAAVVTMTGGLAGVVAGAAWWTRSAIGGTAAAVSTTYVGNKMDARVNKIGMLVQEDYEAEVTSIENYLRDNTLREEDLEHIYQTLSNLYSNVDVATQQRIMTILATAIGTGLLVGAAAGAVMEGFGGDSTPERAGLGAEKSLSLTPDEAGVTQNIEIDVRDTQPLVRPTEAHAPATPESAAGDSPSAEELEAKLNELDKKVTEAEQAAGASDGNKSEATLEDQKTSYEAERGDNLWDIMEGQTKAGKPTYLDHVAEGDKQKLIALLAERVNSDAALRTELGFGATADNLQVGAAVDVDKLNQLAEEIAKEKGLYVEATPEAVPTDETASAPIQSNPEAKIGVTSPEKSVTVSLEKINDYAQGYSGGYPRFEADFEKLFVEKIQGPVPGNGLFSFIFGGTPNQADAFKLFGPYSVAEFNELAKADEVTLANELADDSIDIKDYTAWKEALLLWQKQGIVINPTDRFESVARTAFIASLETAKTIKP
ncbi:MAG: hypothetical protein AAB618_01375 [Patescibacteria group bacterium]